MRKQWLYITVFFVIWRCILFGIGAVSDSFLAYRPSFPYVQEMLQTTKLPRWFYSWANFDGVHYLTIAAKGYVGTGLIQAFFPLLPYVYLHTLHLLLPGFSSILLGLFLTNLCAYLLAISWFGFIKEIFNTKVAWWALAALFLFPTSFYLGALYTESLFLLLVVWTFWLARHKYWPAVGLTIALATATRVVGVFLLPALFLEIILLYLTPEKPLYYLKHFQILFSRVGQVFIQHWQAFVCVGFGFVGILIYMLFLQKEFHDPLYFAHVQAAFGAGRQQQLVLYPQVLWRAIKILLTARPFAWTYFIYLQEFLAGLLGCLGLLWAIKSVRLSYSVFALAAFFLPTTTGTFSSLSRYLLVCFPLFLLIARFCQKHPRYMLIWLSFSTLILIINTLLFIQGYWVA